MLAGMHHVAIIGSDYQRSKDFYTRILGLRVIRETYRAERASYKLDLAVGDGTQIELFSFPETPPRMTRPEACGLRHLAFSVEDVENARQKLLRDGVKVEELRVDETTGKRFVFFSDPDGLPVELYEV